MTDLAEAPQFDNFKVLNERDEDGNMVVQLPSSFEIAVPTNDNQIALETAYAFNEDMKQQRERDPMYQDFLATDQNFLNTLRLFYKDKEPDYVNRDWYQDDFKLVDEYVSDMRWRDNNTVAQAMSLGYTAGGISDEQKRRSAYLFHVWDSLPAFHETGGAGFDGLLSNIGKAVADPVNIFGLGLIKGVTKLVGTGLLKSQTKRLVAEVGVTAGTDGLISAGFSYADQSERVRLNMQTDIDMNTVIKAGAIGAAPAGVLAVGANYLSKGAKVLPTRYTDPVKRTIRSASLLFPRYLTTHAGLGHIAQDSAEVLKGTLNKEVKATRQRAELLTQQLERKYKTDYDSIMQDSVRLREVGAMIAYKLDETAPDFLKINPKTLEGKQKAFELQKTTPLLRDTTEEAITQPVDADIARKILAQDKDLDNALTKFVESTSAIRAKIIDEKIIDTNITDLFMKRGNQHLTKVYQAFLDPDFNLKRLYDSKNKSILNKAHAYVADTLNKSAGVRKSNFNANDHEVKTIVQLLAQGQLLEAKKILQQKKLLDPSIREADTMLDMLDNNPNMAGEEIISLFSRAGDLRTEKITGTEFSKAALTARTNIPEEIRNVLGLVEDPIEQLVQTNMNLNSLYHYTEFSNELTFELLRTGQIDRGLVAGGQSQEIVDKSLKDLGVTRTDIDTNKTLRQAVADGDIADKDAFAVVMKENEAIREKSFEQLASKFDDGAIYNPLGVITQADGFKEALDQVLYGVNFTRGPGVGTQIIGGLHRTNVFGQAMKTVYSPVTTARNFVGGFVQFVAVGGGTISRKDAQYLYKTYLPVWAEITATMAQGKPVSKIMDGLRKKGYTAKQIDDALEDVNELYGANILDSDAIADLSRSFRNMGKQGALGTVDSMYDAKLGKVSLRWLDNHMRRFYATGDEVFKALYFSKRKRFYKDIGFAKSDAARKAAKDVRRHLPNYNIAPKGLKLARMTGLGTFTSFTTEILRNTKNIYADAFKDFAQARRLINEGKAATGTPITKKMVSSLGETTTTVAKLKPDINKIRMGKALQRDAALRVGTMTGVMAAAAGGIDVLNDHFADMDTKVRQAYRSFFPEWDIANQNIVLEKDKEGNLRYFNASYANPFVPIGQLLTGTMIRTNQLIGEGKSYDEALTTSFVEAGHQSFGSYLNPGLGTGPILELILNTLKGDEKGREEALKKLGENFTPGAAIEVGKFYRIATGTKKQFDKGPDESKTRSYWDRGYNMLGVTIKNFNLDAGAKRVFRSHVWDYTKAKGEFTTKLSREGISKKAELADAFTAMTGRVDLKTLRAVGGVEKYVEEIVRANAKIFIAQRSLYSKGLDYALILREQSGLSNDEIFDKLETMFKDAGLEERTRTALVNSIAHQEEPPRFEAWVLGDESFKNFRKASKKQEFNEIEIEAIVDLLKDGFDRVREQFEGRSLGIAVREE